MTKRERSKRQTTTYT